MSVLIDKAIETLKVATDYDNSGDYDNAVNAYKRGLEILVQGLRFEKNEIRKEMLTKRAKEYIARAEQLKKELNDKSNRQPQNSNPSNPNDGTNCIQRENETEGGSTKKKDKDEEKLNGAIASAIVKSKPNVKWEDVVGLEKAKEALREAVILPIKYPHLFKGDRKPWKGILLYGVPGTGKSYIAKAVATECDSTFFSISSADLVSKYQGESERLVKQLFEMARAEAPSIVFIDEIDSLCSARGASDESESSKRIKTEFLVQMQGVGNDDDTKQVLVLGATNYPNNLDSAIRRRFEKRIEIVLPNEEARYGMFKQNLKNTKDHNLTDEDLKYFARVTDGYSAGDISTLVRDALMQPIRALQKAKYFKRDEKDGKYYVCEEYEYGAEKKTLMEIESNDLGVPKVTRAHFEDSLKTCRSAVGQDDIDRINAFTKEFGQEA